MLSAKYRVRQQRDFDNVYKRGRAVSGPLFNLRFAPNRQTHSRLAFVISKKTEKLATRRNLAKRRLRSMFKEALNNIKPGVDIVVLIKRNAVGAEYSQLRLEVDRMLSKAKLI